LFRRLERPVAPNAGVITCFRDGTVTLRSNRRTAGFTESIQEIGYQGVRVGDLVIHAMDSFAGAVGDSESDGKCTPMHAVCAPQMLLEPRFYAFLIQKIARRGWILAVARGIRKRSTDFRFDTFASQLLPYPSLDEQADIVKYLAHVDRKIDRLIRSKRRMIELLNEQKQAIIHQEMTKGLDPSVPMEDSGVEWLAAIPAHWNFTQIPRAVKLVTSGSRGWSRPYPDHSDVFLLTSR
jgi:type I restriction enzyme S subunit